MASDAWASGRRLLACAAIFHLAVALSILAVGRTGLLPGTFDRNGIAVSFAPDGIQFQREAARLSETIKHGHFREWFTTPFPFHVKLYSLCFALLGKLFGPTILSAELLNSFCYLATLACVFKLGEKAYNRRVGLLASFTVAVWPSFVLHSTQLLKDPLFVGGMLAFILVTLRLLVQPWSWTGALLHTIGGGLLVVFIWFARDNMGELLIVTSLLGAVLLIAKLITARHQLANLVAMMLLVIVTLGVTRVVPKFRRPDKPPLAGLERWENPAPDPGSRFAARVGKVRQRFVLEFPGSTSNIDAEVQLDSLGDLLRYLPRAAVVGFFAPFPRMWFARGTQVGVAGRLVSGIETLALYLVECLALLGLAIRQADQRGAQRFAIWLLVLVAASGLVSLGLVVVNAGALYRLRYVFVILLLIPAANGIRQLFALLKSRFANHVTANEPSVPLG
jgi:hypothetical protein